MKSPTRSTLLMLLATLALSSGAAQAAPPQKAAAADPPFIQSAYLWTQATDTDLGGSGDWGMYKS